MKHKTLALFLALLMLASSAAGCSDAGDEAEAADTAANTVAETETETERPYADLPEVDMGGADMTILVGYNEEKWPPDTIGVSKNEFGAAELTGEAVNDARYNRNQLLNERYNCVISSVDQNEMSNKNVLHPDMTKNVDTLMLAGDNNYAFMLLQGYTTCQMAINGTLNDLGSMEYLGLENPWWDQKANENLTVMDKLYYTTGDISTADNDATCTVFFNKKLAADHAMEDPYQMVRDGSWTLDVFLNLCETTSLDLNGDGKYSDADQYGALVWDDITMAVVNGAGIKCAEIGEDGKITLTLNTERTINALDKYIPFGRDETQCFQYQRHGSAADTLAIQMFSNNQAMFFMQLMQMVPKLRDMDADFGILPFPKYDEAQDEYYNLVGSWHSVFFCMPFSNVDLDHSTILAEALACEGMYTVTPAYYEMTLKNKSARDEESAEMLDIIFETRVYDLGWYYQFGMYNEEVMNLFRLNYTAKEFSSMYASKEKKALDEVDKANKAFEEVAAGN
ncbi:MAG: hypothetical protein IKV57_05545 [Clostridia bacterium]|nr:hypothetical protein [Clostridia bacterium]